MPTWYDLEHSKQDKLFKYIRRTFRSTSPLCLLLLDLCRKNKAVSPAGTDHVMRTVFNQPIDLESEQSNEFYLKGFSVGRMEDIKEGHPYIHKDLEYLAVGTSHYLNLYDDPRHLYSQPVVLNYTRSQAGPNYEQSPLYPAWIGHVPLNEMVYQKIMDAAETILPIEDAFEPSLDEINPVFAAGIIAGNIIPFNKWARLTTNMKSIKKFLSACEHALQEL